MPTKRRRTRKKSKYVTRRGLPMLLMNQAEPKQTFAQQLDLAYASTLPIQVDYSIIAQGDAISNRDGQQIQVTGFYGKFTFSNDDDAPPLRAYYARVVLYTPRDPGAVALDVQPAQLIDFEQYVVYFDKVVPIPWANSTSNSIITIKKKWKPYMKMIWDTGTTGSCIKNKLQLMITTDCEVGQLVRVSYGARMYFRDL